MSETLPEAVPISVVLPTYNRSATLPRAIRSVLAQSAPPTEVIVVDDGSDEDIRAIVDQFGDERLRYLRLDRNRGAGAARNAGVEAARCDWIAFQDSDDEWLLGKLELQWQAAQAGNSDAALICGSYLMLSSRTPAKCFVPTPAMLSRSWTVPARFAFPFITPTWLLPRSTFLRAGGFDESLHNLEDWELTFRLYDYGGFIALPDTLLVKHSSSDSLNSDAAAQVQSLIAITHKHAAMWADAPQIRAELGIRTARHHYRLGARRAALHALWQAFRLYPCRRNFILYGAGLAGRRVFLRAWQAMQHAPGIATGERLVSTRTDRG